MKKTGYIIMAILLLSCSIKIKAEPRDSKTAIRGVWLTTNYGLDWPSRTAVTLEQTQRQKDELCRLLDLARDMNLNTVFFQARVRSDVLYTSDYEQYSSIMTGTYGRKPLYDPLAFAVEECHKRGLQCHAWVVCMNIGKEDAIKKRGKNSLPSRRPEICTKYKGEWYLNPGVPATGDYLAAITTEIAERYDIDGIHLDYIRYPDRAADFPDKKEYARYAPSGMTLSQWRINNINTIVGKIYDSVKACDSTITVSSAVLGKRDNLPDYSSYGWSGIEAAYQDAAAWLKAGKMDFIAPMLYYSDASFYPFLKDWIKNSSGYPVVTGLGAYRLAPDGGNWSIDDFARQINIGREFGAAGEVYYRMAQLSSNVKGLGVMLAPAFNPHPAPFPPIKNAPGEKLEAPSRLQVTTGAVERTITWSAVKGAKYYTLYASETYPVDTRKAENIIETELNDTTFATSDIYPYYAVTATDAYYRETEAVQQQKGAIYFKEGERITLPADNGDICRRVEITDTNGTPIYSGFCDEAAIKPPRRGVYAMKITYKNKVEHFSLIIN